MDVRLLVRFLRKLFDVGYLGEGKPPVVAFEVKPGKGRTAKMVLANAKRFLNEAWALI